MTKFSLNVVDGLLVFAGTIVGPFMVVIIFILQEHLDPIVDCGWALFCQVDRVDFMICEEIKLFVFD